MMKTQYIKPEIQMVLLEKKLMASNSISWTVDNSNKKMIQMEKTADLSMAMVLMETGEQTLKKIHLTATTGNQKYM